MMRKRSVMLASMLAAGLVIVGVPSASAGAGRQDQPLVFWCDSDASNGDGTGLASITPNETTAAEGGVDDDVIAKVTDIHAEDPGRHDANNYNTHAGVVQGWFCAAETDLL